MSRKVQRMLHHLGQTADQVAASLNAMCIRGNPQDPNNCPVTNYLMQKAHVQRCWANKSTVIFMSRWLGTHMEVKLPTAVKEFVDAFDHGKYPSLQIWAHYHFLNNISGPDSFQWLQ